MLSGAECNALNLDSCVACQIERYELQRSPDGNRARNVFKLMDTFVPQDGRVVMPPFDDMQIDLASMFRQRGR